MVFTFTEFDKETYGGAAVEFTCTGCSAQSKFTIRADSRGVVLTGLTSYLTSQEHLDELQRVIQWAYRHHLAIQATKKPLNQDDLTSELAG